MGSFWGQLGGFYRDPANHFSECRLNWRCPLKFRGLSRDSSVVPSEGFVGGSVGAQSVQWSVRASLGVC